MIYSLISIFNLEYNKESIFPTQASSLILHREGFQNQLEIVFLLSKLPLDLPKSGKDFGSDVFHDSPTILFDAISGTNISSVAVGAYVAIIYSHGLH
jgi:hypothetical protein